MEYRIGCSGWSYPAWAGHFYPASLESKDYLKYYSGIFDTVEIDSSYYRIPNAFMTQKWAKATPDNFRFTAKFPKTITHERRLAEPEKDLDYLYASFRPLRDKMAAFLIQLPPSLSKKEAFKKLELLAGLLDRGYRYAVEFRHDSWFEQETYDLLSSNNICMAWSVLDSIKIPPKVTTDFIYLRFIGDRSIDEKDFGMIQRDRAKEMKSWAAKVKKISEVPLAIVVQNNHYAGFGPGSANMFRKMVGLPEATFEEMKQARLV